jgi:hypothetical protein
MKASDIKLLALIVGSAVVCASAVNLPVTQGAPSGSAVADSPMSRGLHALRQSRRRPSPHRRPYPASPVLRLCLLKSKDCRDRRNRHVHNVIASRRYAPAPRQDAHGLTSR